jgi:hypothetical protein
MKNYKARKALLEAAELGKRFPDLPDSEVYEHVRFVVQIRPGPIFNKAIIAAYVNKDPEKGFQSFQTWTGIDLR